MHSTISNTLALLAIVGGVAAAAEMLPAKALPLSTILTGLEKAGLTMIVDANFDDGVWEVEGMRGNRAVEVHVDPCQEKFSPSNPNISPPYRALRRKQLRPSPNNWKMPAMLPSWNWTGNGHTGKWKQSVPRGIVNCMSMLTAERFFPIARTIKPF